MNFIKNFLKGYLTYITGFAMVCIGVGGFILHFASPENAMAMNPHDAWVAITGGLVALGIRRNQDEIKKTVETK